MVNMLTVVLVMLCK